MFLGALHPRFPARSGWRRPSPQQDTYILFELDKKPGTQCTSLMCYSLLCVYFRIHFHGLFPCRCSYFSKKYCVRKVLWVELPQLIRCPNQQLPVTQACCHSGINRTAKINFCCKGVISLEYAKWVITLLKNFLTVSSLKSKTNYSVSKKKSWKKFGCVPVQVRIDYSMNWNFYSLRELFLTRSSLNQYFLQLFTHCASLLSMHNLTCIELRQSLLHS